MQVRKRIPLIKDTVAGQSVIEAISINSEKIKVSANPSKYPKKSPRETVFKDFKFVCLKKLSDKNRIRLKIKPIPAAVKIFTPEFPTDKLV